MSFKKSQTNVHIKIRVEWWPSSQRVIPTKDLLGKRVSCSRSDLRKTNTNENNKNTPPVNRRPHEADRIKTKNWSRPKKSWGEIFPLCFADCGAAGSAFQRNAKREDWVLSCFARRAKSPDLKSSSFRFSLKKKTDHPEPAINGNRNLLR